MIQDRNSFGRFVTTFPKNILKVLDKDMFDLANEYRNNVILAMRNTPKDTSKQYKYNRVSPHNPSKPGNPPAIDSGNLISRILIAKLKFGEAMTYVDGAPYVNALEDGTKKMEARPVWENQLEKLNIINKITSTIEKEMIKA